MKQSNGAACLGIKKFTPSILSLNPEKNILNSQIFRAGQPIEAETFHGRFSE